MVPSENEFRECLGHFVINTQCIIRKLEDLKVDIRNHHENCNIARTVGVSMGTVGGLTALGCFIAAPFTFGATLPFAIAGTIVGAGGGITNVSTSITDMIKTKNYKKEIESIGNERKEIAKELGGHLDFLNHVALELEKNGLDKDSAYKVAFTYAKFGYNTFMFKKDALTIATGIIDSIKLAENVSLSGTVATSIGYVTLAGGKTVKMEFGTTFLLTNTLSKLGIEMGRTAKDVLGTLVTGVSVIFMVTDIVFLVKDWQSEHPTMEYLDNIIKTLQEELEPIKELFMFFNTNEYDNKLEDNDKSSMDEKELNESLTKLQEKLENPIGVQEYDIIDNNNNDNNSNKLL